MSGANVFGSMWRSRIFGSRVPDETPASTYGISRIVSTTARTRRTTRGISGIEIAMMTFWTLDPKRAMSAIARRMLGIAISPSMTRMDDCVEQPHVAREEADEEPEGGAEGRHRETHGKGDPRPEDGAGVHVAAEMVGPEPAQARGLEIEPDRLHHARGLEANGRIQHHRVRREIGRERGHEGHREEDGRAHDNRRVAPGELGRLTGTALERSFRKDVARDCNHDSGLRAFAGRRTRTGFRFVKSGSGPEHQ